MDFYGNVGGYKVHENAKMYVLSLMEIKDLENFLNVYKKLNFECVNVQ